MLQLRNTPDRDCNRSPAEIIFGRRLRDAFSFCNRKITMFNPAIESHWREAWGLKELALRNRYVRWCERHNEHVKDLRPLKVGDRCFVQNQEGPHSKKWDRSGLVVEVLPYNKYTIKIDGSGRLTRRNRRFLRLYKPASAFFTENTTVDDDTYDDHERPIDYEEVGYAESRRVIEDGGQYAGPERGINENRRRSEPVRVIDGNGRCSEPVRVIDGSGRCSEPVRVIDGSGR